MMIFVLRKCRRVYKMTRFYFSSTTQRLSMCLYTAAIFNAESEMCVRERNQLTCDWCKRASHLAERCGSCDAANDFGHGVNIAISIAFDSQPNTKTYHT